MNKEDIIRMAREAGAEIYGHLNFQTICVNGKDAEDFVERFAALVAAASASVEREACAKVAAKTVCDIHLPTGIKIYGTRVAAAIRARGASNE